MSKRAIVTGITGQDGSYLAELLLEKGYQVVGVARRLSTPNTHRIEHLRDRIELRTADLLDQMSLLKVIDEVRPHEFYNLAAMSFVPASWDQPMLTGEFNAQGVTRLRRNQAYRHVDSVLSGIVERNVRKGARDPANGGDPLLSAKPVWSLEGVRPLHHGKLS
jgi:GDPmannose 4,6-dehydratase